jgi:hypothetical protein
MCVTISCLSVTICVTRALLETILSHKQAPHWNDKIISGQRLQVIDATLSIDLINWRRIWPLAPRQTLLGVKWQCMRDNSAVDTEFHTVEHTDTLVVGLASIDDIAQLPQCMTLPGDSNAIRVDLLTGG